MWVGIKGSLGQRTKSETKDLEGESWGGGLGKPRNMYPSSWYQIFGISEEAMDLDNKQEEEEEESSDEEGEEEDDDKDANKTTLSDMDVSKTTAHAGFDLCIETYIFRNDWWVKRKARTIL